MRKQERNIEGLGQGEFKQFALRLLLSVLVCHNTLKNDRNESIESKALLRLFATIRHSLKRARLRKQSLLPLVGLRHSGFKVRGRHLL